MLYLNFANSTTTTGTAIGITTQMNTNEALTTVNNTIQVLTPGYYEIIGSVDAMSTASGDYGVGIYANGTLYGQVYTNLATASGEEGTIPIYSVISIKAMNEQGYATIAFMPVGAPSIAAGSVAIKKIS